MSNLGRHDLALELITNINSREAIRLRSDILWATQRWREAGEQIELMYGERWRELTPLNDIERSDILRAAIGYALGEETIGLSRLREKYGPKFADGPDRRAFEIVSAPIGTSGAEFKNVAEKVAGVDTLDAFLRDLRARYPESSAISPGGGAGDAPPGASALDKSKGPVANTAAPVQQGQNARDAGSSPLPPKAPAGVPVKPDTEPTGSIPRLPKLGARAR
jgi:hypothetical protein